MTLTIDFPASDSPDMSKVSPFRHDEEYGRPLIAFKDISRFEVSEGFVAVFYLDPRAKTTQEFLHTFATSLDPEQVEEVLSVIRTQGERHTQHAYGFCVSWEYYAE